MRGSERPVVFTHSGYSWRLTLTTNKMAATKWMTNDAEQCFTQTRTLEAEMKRKKRPREDIMGYANMQIQGIWE